MSLSYLIYPTFLSSYLIYPAFLSSYPIYPGAVPFAWFDREERMLEQVLPIDELLPTAVPGVEQLAGEAAFCSSTLWVAKTQLNFTRRRRSFMRSSLRAAAARQLRRAQGADPDSLDNLQCWYCYLYIPICVPNSTSF